MHLQLIRPVRAAAAAAISASAALCAGPALAVTLSFEDLVGGDATTVGTLLGTQYAALGAVFSANAFSGPGSSSSGADWATNSDLHIVRSAGTDVGELGGPSRVGGNLLRSLSGWGDEDGDPSFRITFGTAVTAVSADFAGVETPGDVKILAYNGSTLVAQAMGNGAGGQATQFGLGVAAPLITSVVFTPGSFDDWVGVDNIVFSPVPEPSIWMSTVAGLAGLSLLTRRRRRVRAALNGAP